MLGFCVNISSPVLRAMPLARMVSYPRSAYQCMAPSRPRLMRTCKVEASAAGAAGDPPEDAGLPGPTKSGERQAVSLPYGAPTAGAVFLLAGFLKLLIMCFPFTPIAIAMYMRGRVDLGYWAVIKMLPVCLGLVALAKFLVDRRLHERDSVRWAVVAASIAALYLSRLLFYMPGHRPNHVLAPMIHAQQQAQAARVQEQKQEMQRRQQAREQALKGPGDAEEFLKAREQMLRGYQGGQQQEQAQSQRGRR